MKKNDERVQIKKPPPVPKDGFFYVLTY